MLDETQIQQVRMTLATDGWNRVIKPLVQKRGNAAVKALTVTRSERAVDFKGSDYDTEDDVLRAMIRDCEWMLVVWDNEVLVHDQNRRRDELAAGGQ